MERRYLRKREYNVLDYITLNNDTTELGVNRPIVMCETRVYEAACFNKHNHVRCKETTTSVCLHTITSFI